MLVDFFRLSQLFPQTTIYKKLNGESSSATDAATGVLRFAAAGNRMLNRMPDAAQGTSAYPGEAGNPVRQGSRNMFILGSGDLSELRALCNNFIVKVSYPAFQAPGDTLTIINLFLESVNLVQSVRVTFNGGDNGIVLANGAYDILSDPILPSSFGLSKFTRGEAYYWRAEVEIPQGAASNMPQAENGDYTTSSFLFNPNTTVITDIGAAGTGVHSSGGIIRSSVYGSWRPITVGKFISGDPKVVMAIGDSITNGVGNSGAPTQSGRGYFSKMLHNGGSGQHIAGLNCGVSGGFLQSWCNVSGGVTNFNEAPQSLGKYANVIVSAYGTNNFDTVAAVNNATLDTHIVVTVAGYKLLSDRQATGAGIRPMEFYNIKLAPRTNTPPTSGVDDQTYYGVKWGISVSGVKSNTDYFNDAFESYQPASSTIYNIPYTQVSFDSVYRADPTGSDTGSIYTSPRYHKWLNGVTTCGDGTHMNWVNWQGCADILKAAIGL